MHAVDQRRRSVCLTLAFWPVCCRASLVCCMVSLAFSLVACADPCARCASHSVLCPLEEEQSRSEHPSELKVRNPEALPPFTIWFNAMQTNSK